MSRKIDIIRGVESADLSTSTVPLPEKLHQRNQCPVHVTSAAINRMHQMLRAGEHIRFYVQGGGCSGFRYSIVVDEKSEHGDTVCDLGNGVNLFIDSMSLQYLHGTTVDYVTRGGHQGFSFSNPNCR